MVSVDFTDGVCSAVFEEVVEIFDLVIPIFVRAMLPLWEHEGFSRIEEPIDFVKVGFISSYFKDPRQTEEVEGCSARLEDETVGRHEERGFTIKKRGMSTNLDASVVKRP